MVVSGGTFASLLLVSALALHGAFAAVDVNSLLWPIPKQVTVADDTVRALDPDKFQFMTDVNSATLNEAFQRYMGVIFKSPLAFIPDGASEDEVKVEMAMLTVKVTSSDETLGEDTDESYVLDTKAGTLTGATVYGALRGLETFSQLVYRNMIQQYLINDVTVNDAPRFKFRATMIDTSRHFLPVQTIFDHLDAMSYSKFNILHWHIVDDQSFPYTSVKYPNLTTGAYDREHTYSQDEIAKVIQFAKFRGIRVIIEFDTPGHTQSWGIGQPGLLTECYSNGKPNGNHGPINPILDSTWTFLKNLFTELASVFPDQYFHLGGDEVSFSCWQSNPDIQQWMKQNNLTDYSKLEQYYEQKLLDLVATLGKKYIVWQDIFDNNVQVKPDTVMNVWKGGWENELAKITGANLHAIMSTCWYLNYISYGADWTKYYACDPQAFNGTDAQKALVIGGETCMWGEFVDATNFLSRFWPRACAVSERLWSPAENNNTNTAKPRLHNMRCRLVSRQIPAEPLGPSYCSYEWSGTEN